ncbi:hypothetical protein HY772_09650 [Candidatus Woesearchaeota archaeon]|nr:hypothetical protein [Candidatus Woesearchaeota archaeon]
MTLTETGANTGIFQYTTGLALSDSDTGDSASILLVSSNPGGDTINISYTDANNSSDTESKTLNSNTLLTGFTVTPSSTTQIAGTPFSLTITALKDGGTLTTYSGTVNLAKTYVSPTSGTFDISPTTSSGVSFANGVATLNVTYNDAGTLTITATDSSDSSMTGTTSNIIFYPYDFSLTASSLDTAAAGSAYARHMVAKPFTLAVTARNASGTTTPNYTGTANLAINYTTPSSSQSGSLNVSSLTSNHWSSGIATITTQSYDKWGTITITSTDAALTTRTGTSNNIIFLPKDFTVSLSSPKPSRTYYYANENFSATVTARDYNNTTLANYQGTVSLSGSGLNLPGDYTFTSSDNGSHTFSDLSGSTTKSTTLSVKDSTYTSITGSTDVTVKTATLKVVSGKSPIGTAKVTLKLVDSSSNILSEDNSTTFKVKLSESKADNSASSGATDTSVTVNAGIASINVKDNESEVVTITPINPSPDMSVASGTITFSTFPGAGVGVPLWRELKDKEEGVKKE